MSWPRTNQVIHAIVIRGVGAGGVIALVMENEIPLLEVFSQDSRRAGTSSRSTITSPPTRSATSWPTATSQAVFCSTSYTDVIGICAPSAGIPEAMRIAVGGADSLVNYDNIFEGSRPTGRATAPPVG